jgi:hypothetical protein
MRLMGRRLVIALAVVILMAACASPAGTGAPSASQTAALEPTPASSIEPTPSEEPSGSAEAVMSFTQSCDAVPDVNVPATTVVADGRVIWRGDDGRLLVRQFTPGGLDDFKEEVRSTGLFEESAQYELVRRPGTPDPPGHGLCVWSFTWRDDGAATDIEVDAVQWLGDEEESAYFEPSPERQTLDELAHRLMDPPASYGEGAWQEPAASLYVPEEYLVLVAVALPGQATEGAPDFDDVTWPFDLPPDEFGVAYGFSEPPMRCAMADAESVATLVAEIGPPGLEPPFYAFGAGLPWQARDATVYIGLWPTLPGGRPTCERGDG